MIADDPGRSLDERVLLDDPGQSLEKGVLLDVPGASMDNASLDKGVVPQDVLMDNSVTVALDERVQTSSEDDKSEVLGKDCTSLSITGAEGVTCLKWSNKDSGSWDID